MIIKLDDLLNHIQSDQSKHIENKVDEPLIIHTANLRNSIEQSTRRLNGEFLYLQLLIDCLVRTKPAVNDKNELIRFCKKFYTDHPNELKIIGEFEQKYSSDQALWWYIQGSFLYRLLNKALRMQNINLLFLFRFFIHDIEEQLEKFRCTTTIRVYRGQLMSMTELNKLKSSLGQYISVNSFFSTSLNRQKAIMLLKDYSFSHNLENILFEIDANPQLVQSKPFANLSSISTHPKEEEILFMLGSIFHLVNIKQDTDGVWIIQMVLSNLNDRNLKQLFDNIKNEFGDFNEETSLISLGNISYQMGKYNSAENYFHQLLNELPNDHNDISKCYHALGVLALMKDNYDLSLKWHGKALEVLKPDDPLAAGSYHCIGCVYQRKEIFINSQEFYKKAWNIWKKNFGEDYYQIADCLNNMGCLYEREYNYSKALEYHQKALSIRKKHLPENHSDLGASYNNIGNVYLALEQYDIALNNYKYSLEIKTKSLSSNHSSIASTLENIGHVYEHKKLYEQALAQYEKAGNIFRKIFSPRHSQIIEIEQNIQRVLSMLEADVLTTCF